MSDPIKTIGYGEWVEVLCERYQYETILFRRSDSVYENALLNCNNTKNMIVGVFNNITKVGKVFDRRKVVRK